MREENGRFGSTAWLLLIQAGKTQGMFLRRQSPWVMVSHCQQMLSMTAPEFSTRNLLPSHGRKVMFYCWITWLFFIPDDHSLRLAEYSLRSVSRLYLLDSSYREEEEMFCTITACSVSIMYNNLPEQMSGNLL